MFMVYKVVGNMLLYLVVTLVHLKVGNFVLLPQVIFLLYLFFYYFCSSTLFYLHYWLPPCGLTSFLESRPFLFTKCKENYYSLFEQCKKGK